MTFTELLDAEIDRVAEEIVHECTLTFNEQVFGSAYGPWPTPKFTGLATLIIRPEDNA